MIQYQITYQTIESGKAHMGGFRDLSVAMTEFRRMASDPLTVSARLVALKQPYAIVGDDEYVDYEIATMHYNVSAPWINKG